MHLSRSAAAIVLATATLAAAMSPARAVTCEELWVERNQYYKDAGYCFRTTRALSYFGNGGCVYHSERELRFPRSIRARLSEIIWLERRMRCIEG
jgi:YARHG domain